MKYLKMLSLAAVSAMALIAFVGAGTASATTLEISGFTKNEGLTIVASLKTGTTLKLRDTFFITMNTCTGADIHGHTINPFTNTTYVTEILETLAFTGCSHTVTVHNNGKLYIDHEEKSTNGNVYSEETEVTTFSTALGEYLNCTTGVGTLIGTLTGASGHAELHINASPTCVRGNGTNITVKWEGTYTVTSPTGLGVSP